MLPQADRPPAFLGPGRMSAGPSRSPTLVALAPARGVHQITGFGCGLRVEPDVPCAFQPPVWRAGVATVTWTPCRLATRPVTGRGANRRLERAKFPAVAVST
jgi:hypothetical protein